MKIKQKNATVSTNNTISSISDYFGHLSKALNISSLNLFLIFGSIGLGILFFMIIVIVCIRRSVADEDKKRKSYKKLKLYEPEYFDNVDDQDLSYGIIDLTLNFDNLKQELKIRDMHILNITLPSTEKKDFYICAFMKSKTGKPLQLQRTKTVYGNSSPNFRHELKFSVKDLKKLIIYFQLYQEKITGFDNLFRESKIDFNDIYLGNFKNNTYNSHFASLYKPLLTGKSNGELLVILCGDPPKLEITILEGKNIPILNKMQVNFKSFLYVEVRVFVDKKEKKYFKTHKVTISKNPYFLEIFRLEIIHSLWGVTVIKIEMFLSNPMRLRQKIGEIYIGNKASHNKIVEHGNHHWQIVLRDPRLAKARWHLLL